MASDTPRRLGNEFLFQELAAKNIEEFEKNDVQKIVTIDPHAYNIFKNEYPDFGLKAEDPHEAAPRSAAHSVFTAALHFR